MSFRRLFFFVFSGHFSGSAQQSWNPCFGESRAFRLEAVSLWGFRV